MLGGRSEMSAASGTRHGSPWGGQRSVGLRQSALAGCRTVPLGRHWIGQVDGEQLPVALLLVHQRQRAQQLDLQGRARRAMSGSVSGGSAPVLLSVAQGATSTTSPIWSTWLPTSTTSIGSLSPAPQVAVCRVCGHCESASSAGRARRPRRRTWQVLGRLPHGGVLPRLRQAPVVVQNGAVAEVPGPRRSFYRAEGLAELVSSRPRHPTAVGALPKLAVLYVLLDRRVLLVGRNLKLGIGPAAVVASARRRLRPHERPPRTRTEAATPFLVPPRDLVHIVEDLRVRQRPPRQKRDVVPGRNEPRLCAGLGRQQREEHAVVQRIRLTLLHPPLGTAAAEDAPRALSVVALGYDAPSLGRCSYQPLNREEAREQHWLRAGAASHRCCNRRRPAAPRGRPPPRRRCRRRHSAAARGAPPRRRFT